MEKKAYLGVGALLLLLASSYVFAKFQGGFVSWFIFWSFLPVVSLILVLFLLAFKGASVEREITKIKYTSGESVYITLRIHNPYRIPFMYLIIEDQVDPRLKDSLEESSKQVILGGFKKEFTTTYVLQDVPRGVFLFKDIYVETGDLFGLVKRRQHFTFDNEIVVYPKYQRIRYWRTVNERNIGTRYSFNRQDEDVSSVMGIRDYAPGDRLARIHWKATARTNTLKTKEYEHQVTNDFMFFLDRQKKWLADGTGTEGESKGSSQLFEKSVSLTASLVRFVLKQHFSAGLVSYGQTPTVMNLARDQEQLYRIYEHLARVEQDTTYSFLKTVLREVSFLPLGTTVVIITAQLDQKIVSMLNDLSYRKIKVEFFWIKDAKEANEAQKHCLGMLTNSQINYYIVADYPFEEALSGGGQHAAFSAL